MKKFHIINFGCQMNAHDSEFIEGIMTSMGLTRCESEKDADIVLVNTCCVRLHAEERAIGRVTQLKRIKKENKDFIICIAGCLAQRDGEELGKKLPFVDIILGTGDLPNLKFSIEEVRRTGNQIVMVNGITGDHDFNLPVKRNSDFKAMITIMRGCNNFCSYCIVPYVRGRELSRSASDIVDESKRLADSGVKEILLLGQNVNSYRDNNIDFPELLRKMDSESGIRRIRFMTSHPKDASDELFHAMAELKSVCKHLHLPAQAGNNRILELMNRKYSRENYIAKIEKLRSLIPGIAITTDLMVGYPSETEDEYEDTIKLAEQIRWDMAFMFIYSIREGTAAAKAKDDVPREEKVRRIQRLIRTVEDIAAEKNENLKETVDEVLVECVSKKNSNELLGRTGTDKTIIFHGSSDLIGKFVNVKIEKTTAHTLNGILVQ